MILQQLPQLHNFTACRPPQSAQVRRCPNPAALVGFALYFYSKTKQQSKMASLQPKNSGGPITKFWDAPETIATLEHVKGWLCKHAKKVSLDL